MKFIFCLFIAISPQDQPRENEDASKFLRAMKNIETYDGPYISKNSDPAAVNLIKDSLLTHWNLLPPLFVRFSGSDYSVLLAVAMQEMNDFEYMRFTIQMLDQVDQGNVNAELVMYDLLNPNDDKDYFCAINYKHPELRTALMSVMDELERLHPKSELDSAKSILNGDGLDAARSHYKMMDYPLPPSLEQLKKVGKSNRADWTAADAASLNHSPFRYVLNADSWKLHNIALWSGLVLSVFLITGAGYAAWKYLQRKTMKPVDDS